MVVAISVFLGWKFFVKDAEINLNGEASLSWGKVEGDDVAGYNIYYGDKKRTNDCPSGGYSEKIDAGNKTQYIIKNLEPNKTYYFSVTSYNKNRKESCFSEEKTKEVKINFGEKIKRTLKTAWANF